MFGHDDATLVHCQTDATTQVSLGGKGSKTQESKQDFLNRTRKEREEREAHRRREKAAERIQVKQRDTFIRR
jgi:hypothetical protein